MSPRLSPSIGAGVNPSRPMNEKRRCCRCGFDNAFLKTFYLEAVGYFVPGAEPWSCRECLDFVCSLQPDAQRYFFESKGFVVLTTAYQYIGALGAAFMDGSVAQ